jgi:hypothetical protein
VRANFWRAKKAIERRDAEGAERDGGKNGEGKDEGRRADAGVKVRHRIRTPSDPAKVRGGAYEIAGQERSKQRPYMCASR